MNKTLFEVLDESKENTNILIANLASNTMLFQSDCYSLQNAISVSFQKSLKIFKIDEISDDTKILWVKIWVKED